MGRLGGHYLFQSARAGSRNPASRAVQLSRNDRLYFRDPSFAVALVVPDLRAFQPDHGHNGAIDASEAAH